MSKLSEYRARVTELVSGGMSHQAATAYVERHERALSRAALAEANGKEFRPEPDETAPFLELFKRTVARRVEAGMSHSAAVLSVIQDSPELHRQALAEANPGRSLDGCRALID